jgi:hypothetical protein
VFLLRAVRFANLFVHILTSRSIIVEKDNERYSGLPYLSVMIDYPIACKAVALDILGSELNSAQCWKHMPLSHPILNNIRAFSTGSSPIQCSRSLAWGIEPHKFTSHHKDIG